MNARELAEKVVDCLSDGYDDEEYRELIEDKLYDELSEMEKDSVVKFAIIQLCKVIEELLS